MGLFCVYLRFVKNAGMKNISVLIFGVKWNRTDKKAVKLSQNVQKY